MSEGTELTLNGRDNNFIQSFQSCSLLHRSDFHAHWAGVGGCNTKANTYFDESRLKSSSIVLAPSARYGDKSTRPSWVILNTRVRYVAQDQLRAHKKRRRERQLVLFPCSER